MTQLDDFKRLTRLIGFWHDGCSTQPSVRRSERSLSGTQKRIAEALRKADAAEKGKTNERHHRHKVSVRNAIPHRVQRPQPIFHDAASTPTTAWRHHVRHDVDPTARRLVTHDIYRISVGHSIIGFLILLSAGDIGAERHH